MILVFVWTEHLSQLQRIDTINPCSCALLTLDLIKTRQTLIHLKIEIEANQYLKLLLRSRHKSSHKIRNKTYYCLQTKEGNKKKTILEQTETGKTGRKTFLRIFVAPSS